MIPWFLWNGVDSRQMGLVISTPPRQIPQERVETITIPGRPGALIRTEGEAIYEPYVLTIRVGNRREASMAAILSWLRGSGQLVLSTEPDRVYEARLINAGELNRVFSGVMQGDLQFFCQPLRGQYPPEPAVTVTPSVSVTELVIHNPGDAPARSVYTATGIGDVVFTMDTAPAFEVVFPDDPGGTVTVDTDAGQALTAAGDNFANHVSGTYAGLWIPRGTHTISWSGEGTLSSLSVLPRWRWV